MERLSDERHAEEVEQQRTQTDNRLKQVHKEIKEVSGLQAGIAARLGKRTMSPEAFDAANEPLSIDLVRLTSIDVAESGDRHDELRLPPVLSARRLKALAGQHYLKFPVRFIVAEMASIDFRAIAQ